MRRRLRDLCRVLFACFALAASFAARAQDSVDSPLRVVPPPRPHISTEQTYYAQPHMVGEAVEALEAARPGIPELYFIGFAGTSSEDVFLKEARFAQGLFDARFDTRGR